MEKKNQELIIAVHEKLDIMNDKIHSLDVTSAKQEVNLQLHMKRTEIAEKKMEIFEEKVMPALEAYKFTATCVKLLIPVLTVIGIYYEYFKKS